MSTWFILDNSRFAFGERDIVSIDVLIFNTSTPVKWIYENHVIALDSNMRATPSDLRGKIVDMNLLVTANVYANF